MFPWDNIQLTREGSAGRSQYYYVLQTITLAEIFLYTYIFEIQTIQINGSKIGNRPIPSCPQPRLFAIQLISSPHSPNALNRVNSSTQAENSIIEN